MLRLASVTSNSFPVSSKGLFTLTEASSASALPANRLLVLVRIGLLLKCSDICTEIEQLWSVLSRVFLISGQASKYFRLQFDFLCVPHTQSSSNLQHCKIK